MLTESLKSDVERLSAEDRRELSLFVIQLQLESDEDYLRTIRERTESYGSRDFVVAEDL